MAVTAYGVIRAVAAMFHTQQLLSGQSFSMGLFLRRPLLQSLGVLKGGDAPLIPPLISLLLASWNNLHYNSLGLM